MYLMKLRTHSQALCILRVLCIFSSDLVISPADLSRDFTSNLVSFRETSEHQGKRGPLRCRSFMLPRTVQQNTRIGLSLLP